MITDRKIANQGAIKYLRFFLIFGISVSWVALVVLMNINGADGYGWFIVCLTAISLIISVTEKITQ